MACCTTASEEELAELYSELHTIDSELRPEMTTKKVLEKKANLQAFLQTHCRFRHYAFQVRKCSGCDICKPHRVPDEILEDGTLPWLPDPVCSSEEDTEFLPFNEAIQKDTTESFRPSLRAATLDEDRAADAEQKDILVSAKVRTTVACIACDKPRCV